MWREQGSKDINVTQRGLALTSVSSLRSLSLGHQAWEECLTVYGKWQCGLGWQFVWHTLPVNLLRTWRLSPATRTPSAVECGWEKESSWSTSASQHWETTPAWLHSERTRATLCLQLLVGSALRVFHCAGVICILFFRDKLKLWAW